MLYFPKIETCKGFYPTVKGISHLMQSNIKHHWMRQRGEILPEYVKLILVGIALIALSDAEFLHFRVFFVNFCT
jgi:hypothetical protein